MGSDSLRLLKYNKHMPWIRNEDIDYPHSYSYEDMIDCRSTQVVEGARLESE